eukprot:TRINITY_DN74765_c0_g1_i1.p1 TRINITY_DN74765_c0_g1~~TRINITY_DN74765_c0_g1_i1.p1  ORF type:complete len:143 (+),score=30.84 TRINITY_DN74765_c0_g1_i1:68-496(+)
MAFSLPKLHSAFEVEQAVVSEQSKVVCLRIGQEFDPECMQMDQALAKILGTVESACSVYAVDSREVPECAREFGLTAALSTMFFFKGKPVKIDLGQGPVAAITWAVTEQQELFELMEAVCGGARRGREVIVAPKDYSVQFRY